MLNLNLVEEKRFKGWSISQTKTAISSSKERLSRISSRALTLRGKVIMSCKLILTLIFQDCKLIIPVVLQFVLFISHHGRTKSR